MISKCDEDNCELEGLYFVGGYIDSFTFCLKHWIQNSDEPVKALFADLLAKAEGLSTYEPMPREEGAIEMDEYPAEGDNCPSPWLKRADVLALLEHA